MFRVESLVSCVGRSQAAVLRAEHAEAICKNFPRSRSQKH